MKNKQIDGIYVRQKIHKTQRSTKSFQTLRSQKNQLPLWLGLIIVLIISSLLRSPFHANAFSGDDGTVGNPFLITPPLGTIGTRSGLF